MVLARDMSQPTKELARKSIELAGTTSVPILRSMRSQAPILVEHEIRTWSVPGAEFPVARAGAIFLLPMDTVMRGHLRIESRTVEAGVAVTAPSIVIANARVVLTTKADREISGAEVIVEAAMMH
jgi:hypothetical protein